MKFNFIYLLFLVFILTDMQAQNNPDFYVENGTCKCPDADFGDTGTLTINGVQETYTKRNRADLDALIANDINDPEIALTCTSGITDMSNLFEFTGFNQNINHWDVSNVTDMSSMFSSANSFNQPLDNWDVSNVTNMQAMFSPALSFNQSLNNWDVSSVTDMSSMFRSSSSFNQPLDSWDVSQVTTMNVMFENASSFDQPLNSWDVSNVTDMSRMFLSATSFNQPLDNWDVSNVTNMSGMFLGSQTFDQFLNSWDVSNVTDLSSMFLGAANFNQPLDNWDVSNVTNMSGMFQGDFNEGSAFDQALNNWDVSNVTDMTSMFSRADSFDQPLNNWDVSSVTDMNSMFLNATSFDQPLDNWDVSNVTNMSEMFANSASFNQALDNWDYDQDVQLSGFINSSHLDISNYEDLLQHFNGLGITNKTLGALSIAYCDDQARNDLIDNKGWTIDGDVQGQCGQTFNPSTTPFVTTWTVDDDAPSVNIYTVDFYDYDFTVDWGDGQVDQNVTADIGHTYANAGTYTVSITGVFPYFKVCELVKSSCDNAAKLSSVESWGDQEWRYMLGSFSQAENFVLNTTQAPNLNNVESLRSMFEGAANFDQPINNWDVSNVKDMRSMFAGSFSNNTSFNQPLNSWDVSNVSNMSRMFYVATSFNQPLDSWDVSNVKDMRLMFAGAFSNNTIFNQSLNNWDVSNVTNMAQMLAGTNYNFPLDNWDVSQVTDINAMFAFTPFNQPLNSWDVSNVTDMSILFYGASNFNQDLSNWNVSQVTTMSGMFYGATNFNQDLSLWSFNQNISLNNFLNHSKLSTSNYDALLQSFNNQNLVNLTLGAANIGYCDEQTRSDLINNKGWTILDDIEGQCSENFNPSTSPFVTTWEVDSSDLTIEILTIAAYNYDFTINWGDGNVETNLTDNVEHTYSSPGVYTVSITGIFPYFKVCDIAFGFQGLGECNNSEKLQSVESWGNQEWRNFAGSFRNAQNFVLNTNQVPDLANVNSLKETFRQANSFNQNINNWDVSNITDISGMFRDANSFNQPLDNWDVSNVTNMSFMFSGASNFDQPINNWVVGSVTNMSSMFSSATSFNQPLNNWDVSNVTDMEEMFFDAAAFNQNLSGWCVEQIPTVPTDFSTNSPLQDSFHPDWGETCTLGVEDNALLNVSVYPNPVKESFRLEVDDNMTLQKMSIYSISGRLVDEIEDLSQPINVSSLKTGVYILRIESASGKIMNKRIIKR